MNLNLKIARIKKGLTQKQLREKLVNDFSIGISPSTIVAMEKGEFSNLRYSTMEGISKVLEMPVQELFFSNKY